MADIRNYFAGFKSKSSKVNEEQKQPDKTPSKSKKKTPTKTKQSSGTKTRVRNKSRKTSEDINHDVETNVVKNSDREEKKKSEKSKTTKDKKKPVKQVADEDFQTKREKNKAVKKKTIITIDSESDEDAPPVKKSNKSNKKKKHVISDSDDEENVKAKITTSTFFNKQKSPPAKTPKSSRKAKIATPLTKTPVTVLDFFGKGEIKRSERKTPVKRKLAEISLSATSTDNKVDIEDFDDDDDFQETLRQLDEQKMKKAKIEIEDDIEILPPTPPRENKSKSKTPKKKTPKKTTPVKSLQEVVKEDTPVKILQDTPVMRQSPRRSARKQSVIQSSPASKSTPNKDVRRSPRTTSTIASPQSLSRKLADKVKGRILVEDTPDKKTPDRRQTGTPAAVKNIKSTPETPDSGVKKGTGYRSYLTRDGPRSLGSKEIPEGEDNCLEGLTFVITGVLESVERGEAKSVIERLGGRVTGSLSKKTNYLVLGRDGGESKTNKATQFGTTILDEDSLFELIRTTPGKKSKYVIAAEKEAEADAKKKSKLGKDSKEVKLKNNIKKEQPSLQNNNEVGHKSSMYTKQERPDTDNEDQSEPTLLWVDKYKPQTMKQIIGQQGDKSNAKKLLNWLRNWHNDLKMGKKKGGYNKFSDDGSQFKAALLSGPPGVGKTTTATIVCNELGFSYVELNASDTRSKKSLENVVGESLNNTTIVDFLGNQRDQSHGQNHCMVMDEVDGMAGNEDRGGIQELVQLIKNSKIPIICMCNDRQSSKVRSLANYCFDLRFYRPRVEQIKGAMMSLCFKEGLKVPPPALNEIILASNQDVRQVIHNLSMWSAKEKSMTFDQCKKDSNMAKKDLKFNPFDVCRKVFVGGEEGKMPMDEKMDLFFQDYSIGPLFVQENYVKCTPFAAGGDIKKSLDCIARAADSIADGDVVSQRIRSNQNWNLLTKQAFFSTIIPGDIMRGGVPHMMSFPSWLGKNSTRGKIDRMLQELRTHMRLRISANKESLNMDYLPHFCNFLTQPLIQDEAAGVPRILKLMEEYDLIKDDFDNMLEVTKWPGSKDPLSMISPKVKSAFTRAYNKESHMTPYSLAGPVKKKRGGGGGETNDDDPYGLGEDAGNEEQESDDDTPMIKAKAKSKAKQTKAKTEASTKGKGGGKAKKKGK